ncbi:MAG: hypothetical protein U1F55_07760 [Chitinivorax sp.]
MEADRRAGRGITGYEYAVLVTNTDYVWSGQLYRDRADAENAFDELKPMGLGWLSRTIWPTAQLPLNSGAD